MTAPEIRTLGPGDEDRLVAASSLFDHPVTPDGARRFLDRPGHHLLVAYVEDEPAGFVSGVETAHPDKGAEMFLYELAVDEAHRRKGIARALVNALGEIASGRGCYGMWVSTEPDNAAALATYRSAGAAESEESVTLAWTYPARDI